MPDLQGKIPLYSNKINRHGEERLKEPAGHEKDSAGDL